MNRIASVKVVWLPATALRYVQERCDEQLSDASTPNSYLRFSTRVNNMTTASSKLLPLAVAAMLATLCSPVSAQYNMNTTIQEGRINTNDTYQRGRTNDNATYQEGRDNANRTRQRGLENLNQTGQFGRINYNETSQRGGFKRSSHKSKRSSR